MPSCLPRLRKSVMMTKYSPGEVTLPFLFCLPSQWGLTLKEFYLLYGSKFFPLRVDPFLKGFIFQGRKVTKCVSV